MGRSFSYAVVAAFLALPACGGGDKPASGADGLVSSTTAAPSPSGVATESSLPPGGDAAAPPSTETPTTAIPGTVAPSDTAPDNGSGGGATGGGSGGVPPLTPPDAGTYRYRTTGTSSLGPVDRHDTTTVVHLNETDRRLTAPSPQGNQVSDLRFLPDQIQLLRVRIDGVGEFAANPSVQFLPIPPQGAWQWQLQSTDGRTTISQSGTVTDPAAPTIDSTFTIAGGVAGTIRLTNTFDLGMRMPARTGTVTDVQVGLFRYTDNTTSQFLSFTPDG